MIMGAKHFSPLLIMAVLTACSVKPVEIQYGKDNCHRCEMTIMDRRYGAEIVTAKGKVYKFDSVECLMDFLQNSMPKKEKIEYTLVTSFDEPGHLCCALGSFYLHSKDLPSPMGKYLTAFDEKTVAERYQQSHGGKLYSWDEFKIAYKGLHIDLLE